MVLMCGADKGSALHLAINFPMAIQWQCDQHPNTHSATEPLTN